jgi:hypothetical protein
MSVEDSSTNKISKGVLPKAIIAITSHALLFFAMGADYGYRSA